MPVGTAPPGPGTVSAIVTEPAATCTGVLHVPPGAAPAASAGIALPATVKLNSAPTLTPAPATLQTCTKPLPAAAGIESMKVTIVCPPALTVTLARPAPRLLLTNNPALGKVKMPVGTAPPGPGTASTIVTEPAVTCTGVLHVPPGAAPAGMVTGFPATVKLNSAPTGTPAPATLQT